MSAAFNDEPTVADSLGRAGWVRWFAENLKNCEPPYVFGLHGDWGSGKTSFLHQMYGFFTGYSPAGKKLVPQITNTWGTHWKSSERHIVVIFEAWRYQHEATPVVALLHEIRAQWSWYNKTFKWLGKIGEVATRGALLVFDEATRKIDNDTSIKVKPSSSGIQALGERWEADHFENTLPTQKLREFLSEAIKVLSGDSRIIILIDDLDRCQPEAAYKLLEGIKIYLNLPNCVFVLAMDQQQIQRAVATCMPGGRSGNDPDADATQLHQAAEYMEKICQDIWQLPLMPTTAHELFLRGCLEGHTAGHAEVFEQVFQVLRN
ncbi:MAG: hypothetical protein JWM68_3873, partial [Verrucomicrobiales bacterium]|nr:hypothetical protein [Verrucomicrobiales bacterium]